MVNLKKVNWQKDLFGQYVEVYKAFIQHRDDDNLNDVGLLSTPVGTQKIKEKLELLGYDESNTCGYWFNIKNYNYMRKEKLERILK